MSALDNYLGKNRKQAYEHASENMPHNAEGRAVIPKGDEWREETEWEEQFEAVKGSAGS